MSQTFSVITLRVPYRSGSGNERSAMHDVGQTLARYAYAVIDGSTRAAVAASAAAYLVGHSVAQSSFIRRVKEIATRRHAAPVDPCPDTPLDAVDLASWESFPASDPPGY